MEQKSEDYFILDKFEGPLEYLLPLIKKNEIDILDLILSQIIEQCFFKQIEKKICKTDIDRGADFIATFSHLIWLKSLTLLPQHEQLEEPLIEDQDPHFEMIHHLIDYCRFRDAARSLTEQEQRQSGIYSRGIDGVPEVKKKLGIEHLSIDDFASLFQQIMVKASSQKGTIHEEVWRVSDKIAYIRDLLVRGCSIPFMDIFSLNQSRIELIVTFLAILELIKLGEVCVFREIETGTVALMGK